MRIFNPGPCSCQYGFCDHTYILRMSASHPPSYLRLGVTTMKKKKSCVQVEKECVTPNGQPPVHLLPTAETETETDTDIERPKVRPAGVRGHLSAGRRGRVAAGVLRVPRRRRRREGAGPEVTRNPLLYCYLPVDIPTFWHTINSDRYQKTTYTGSVP